MKYIILLFILVVGSVSGRELTQFKIDDSYFKLTPIVGLTATPYWIKPLINKVTYIDDIYCLQLGIKYKFTKNSFISFKTEYPTDYTLQGGIESFNVVREAPTLILEFNILY